MFSLGYVSLQRCRY